MKLPPEVSREKCEHANLAIDIARSVSNYPGFGDIVSAPAVCKECGARGRITNPIEGQEVHYTRNGASATRKASQ